MSWREASGSFWKDGGGNMTQREITNIILELRKRGWSDTEINSFVMIVATHNPTEQEVLESNSKVLGGK